MKKENERIKKVALLIDKQGYIVNIFNMNIFKHYVDGTVETVTSWELDEKVFKTEFLTKISIKWDGCSHAWFNGQDHLNPYDESDTNSSYYHLCGLEDYLRFTKGLMFSFFAASQCIEICEYEIKKMKEYKDILNGYNIIFIDNINEEYFSEEYIYSRRNNSTEE